MERSEPVRWLTRAVVGSIVAAPLAWLVYQRPEAGYGRWAEAGLYVLAAVTAAVALLLSEGAVALVAGGARPTAVSPAAGPRPMPRSGHEDDEPLPVNAFYYDPSEWLTERAVSQLQRSGERKAAAQV